MLPTHPEPSSKETGKVAVLPLLTRVVVVSSRSGPLLRSCARALTLACTSEAIGCGCFFLPCLALLFLCLLLLLLVLCCNKIFFCYQDGVESGRGFRAAANVSGTSSVCSGHHRWEQEANSESIDRKRRCSNLRVSQWPNYRFGCAFGCVSVCDGCARWGGAGVPVPGQEGSYRFPFQEYKPPHLHPLVCRHFPGGWSFATVGNHSGEHSPPSIQRQSRSHGRMSNSENRLVRRSRLPGFRFHALLAHLFDVGRQCPGWSLRLLWRGKSEGKLRGCG